ncbi:protein of unknown function [Devosia enhydra]|uniref:DUF4376 domain-containing protein n=1 Tax=Devosia enhydra TaxID=665118 RepID=A0A1K2HUD1_9HYPH|nr:DUF4376 domain-containing protein [Devosia enhydra]SFZ81649.1 protein of unknown function [Devosia enhydra]
MTKIAFKDADKWEVWAGQPRPRQGKIDELFALPRNAGAVYPADVLATFGLVQITRDPVPDGHHVVSETLGEREGLPHEYLEFAATPIGALRAGKLAALDATRRGFEEGGTVIAGTPIKTDRQTASILTAAFVTALADPGYTIRWKVADGVFTTLDAPTIVAIATAVRAHVQACFDREGELTEAIMAAGDAEALDAIDITTGWP